MNTVASETLRVSGSLSSRGSLLAYWLGLLVLTLGLAGLAIFAESGKLSPGMPFINLLSYKLTSYANVLLIMGFMVYVGYLVRPLEAVGKWAAGLSTAGAMGLIIALLVRWFESYHVLEQGHVPISNLYEVSIFFTALTTVVYLVLESVYRCRPAGALVMAVVVAGIAFELWLVSLGNVGPQNLMPALKSYWMHAHVLANFIGYGAFAVAAMLGVGYLVKHYAEHPSVMVFWFMTALVVLVVVIINIFVQAKATDMATALQASNLLDGLGLGALVGAGYAAVIWGLMRPRAVATMPSQQVLDAIMYKAIAIGFPTFTVATILGAAWAYDAWGGYWSWDPKETWSLIVWLTYAAWLHLRFVKGWGGTRMAWWSIAGFVVTVFCFLGVNMFLSGMHSYGKLG